MDFILQQSELADLAEKVEAGTRMEIEDALRLYRTPDLNALGRLAALATDPIASSISRPSASKLSMMDIVDREADAERPRGG